MTRAPAKPAPVSARGKATTPDKGAVSAKVHAQSAAKTPQKSTVKAAPQKTITTAAAKNPVAKKFAAPAAKAPLSKLLLSKSPLSKSPLSKSTASKAPVAKAAAAALPAKSAAAHPLPSPPSAGGTPAKATRVVAAAEKPALNSPLKTVPNPATTPAVDVTSPAPGPVAAAGVLAAVIPTKAPRKSSAKSRYGMPMPIAPLPPATSRFADRFAPPRPPTRQMNYVEVDTPRVPTKSDPKLANAWKTKAGPDLSDAEILAMPESEYMNDKQLDFFRATLKKLKDDLLSNAGETTEHLREDTSIVPDPADRATIEEEHALELRTRDRERKLLKKIAQSLNRVESGEYGFCDETGEPIGLGRLIARPTATLSLEAQQRRELKQKMFGD